MKKILVPVDFTPVSGNSLRYAVSLAGHLGADLNLIHCYPVQEYSRPYDFGKKDYRTGIGEMMGAFYEKSVNEPGRKVHFLAKAGSVVENVVFLSYDYDLVVLGSKKAAPNIRQWMSSRTSVIASTANCPVMVIPSSGEYRPIEKIWHIERRENERPVLEKHLGNLKIHPDAIETKSFKQTTFKSALWRSMLTYVKNPKEEIRQVILEARRSESVDLMILVSYEKNSFHQFVNDNVMQVIFQFNIPVLIFQAGLKMV